jgi:hypothetical protein
VCLLYNELAALVVLWEGVVRRGPWEFIMMEKKRMKNSHLHRALT